MKKVATPLAILLIALNGLGAGPKRSAQLFSSSFAVVPSTANVPGLFGAVWKTQVELFNPTTSTYSVQVSLYDKTGKVKEVSIDMAAGQVRNYANFLSDVFSYSGAGALKFDSGSDQNQFVLDASVYTDTANGRYITPVAALNFDASNFASYSLGIIIDSSARTNIGAFNQTPSANTVTAELYDSSGTLVNTFTLTLASQGWNQVAISSNVTGGYIKFIPTLPAYCFAVVVNNTSNDGNFIQAAEAGE
jgi:hypothetical protein